MALRARMLALPLFVLAAVALACGPARSPVDAGGAAGGGSGGSGGGSGGGGGGGGGGAPSCLGQALLDSVGKSRVLVGLSGSDAAAAAAPYDLRYMYLAGKIEDPGATCADWNWWACWGQGQWTRPDATLVRSFIDAARSRDMVPMLTYYLVLQASGVGEGSPEVTGAANDAGFMARYLADWRYLLQKIGNDVAFLHLEPDFWGYAQHVAASSHTSAAGVPAKVKSADPTDCGDQPDTLGGLGRCMISMVRKYAPNAKVGLHASMWASGWNTADASFDPVAEAARTAAFLKDVGAGAGDFIAADMSDRDADWYRLTQGDAYAWYDAGNVKLPHFHMAFAWSKALAEGLALPVIWWQLPVGNASSPNSCDTTTGIGSYKDNRVDYLLGHMDEVAASHGVGLAFGAGAGCNTSPDDDGGNLAARTKAYVAAGGAALCR